MPKATLDTTSDPIQSVMNSSLGVSKTILLSQIELDPITDVRGAPPKDEAVRIDNLAKSIFEDGQLQPVLVRRNGAPDKYLLIAGRRRFAAKKLIEKQLSEHNQLTEPITIDAVIVDKSDEDAYMTAIQENLQRKQFSPMELAQIIDEVRKKNDWNGEDWSKKVSDFLRISRANVTTHYSLLALPVDMRKKVHSGELAAQTAIDLAKIQDEYGEDEAKATLSRAEKRAEKEAVEKAAKAAKAGKGSKTQPTPLETSAAATPEKVKVTSKHVREAAAETGSLVKPRGRNQLVEVFQEVLDSADPYPQPIIDFCKVFVNKFAAGHGTSRMVLNKLDVISELIEGKAKKAKA